MAITRIKNNQITDSTITNAKIVPGTITGGSLNANLSYSGNLTVTGNLSVSGTTTVVDTVNTTIADPLLVLSRNASGSASVDAGLIIERGDDSNVAFVWDESADEFVVATTTEDGTTSGDVSISAYANVKIATAKVETLSDQAGTASPKIAGLTATRVTFGGTNGILTDDAGFTFASDTLTIGNVDIGTNTVETSSGNLTITGAGGGVTTASDVTITSTTASTGNGSGALTVDGGVGIDGNLHVGGAEVDIDGNLTVAGTLGLSGDLSAGNLTLTGDIDASTGTIDTLDGTDASFGGNLSVTGTSTFTGDMDAGNIVASGDIDAATGTIDTLDGTDASFGGNLSVTGTSTFTGNIGGGNLTLTGDIDASTGTIDTLDGTDASFGGNLSVTGTADVTGNLTAGNVSTNVAVITTGNITTVNATTVNATDAVLSGDIDASTGTIDTLDGTDASFGGNLSVTGTSTFTGDMDAGNIVASGDVDASTGTIDTLDGTTATFTTGNITTVNSTTENVGTINVSTLANVQATTASTSNTTGAVIVAGGVGVGGNLHVGGATVDLDGNLAVGGDVVITGNLSVDGTATYVNTTTTTVKDPIMVIGGTDDGGAATADDNKDRGVLFQWHNGTAAKSGFFGFDDSTGRFTFVPDASNSSEVISGSVGDVEINDLYAANGTFTGNLSAANLDLDGITVVDLDVSGNITVDGTSTFTGDMDAGNIVASGDVDASTGTIDTLDGTTATFTTGNITTVNATTVNATDAVLSGDIDASTGTIDTLDGTDASFGGNLSVTGTSTFTGNVSAGNISATGTADVTGNLTAGNVSTNVAVITTGNITTLNNIDAFHGGNVYAEGNIRSLSTIRGNDLTIDTGASVTGNLTAGNIDTTTAVITTGNITTINGTDATFTGNLEVQGTTDVTGNLTAGNIDTATAVITTGNITTVNATDISTSTLEASTSANIADANITGSTASTTTTSGALKVAGGTGIVGNINVGGAKSTFTDTTASTSNSSGVVVLSGGLGVAGNAFVGNLAITENTIISSNTNGNINLAPNGTGTVVINSAGLANDTVIKGETDDNLFYVDASADNVGIGTNTPNAGVKLHINTTDAMILPNGTTAERPGTPAAAMFRFNSDTSFIEYYDSSEWVALSSQFTVIASENFAGDGSTVEFELQDAQTTASSIVSINGVIQLPGTAYSVSGTTLTFTEAPGSTDVIEVRKLTTTQTVSNLADDINGYAALFATPSGVELYAGSSSRTKYVTIDNNGQLRVIATTASTSLSTGALVVEGGAAVNGNIWVAGDIIPGSDEAYDLGSASNKWGSLYLAGATITLGNVVIKDNGGQIAFYQADGTTPTTVDSNNVDTTTIASGTSSMSVISSGGNIRANVGGSTIATVHSGGLNITGATTSSGTVTAGNLVTDGTLSVTAAATVTGNLTVDGTLKADGGITVDGTNFVVNGSSGAVSTASTITATGDITGGNIITAGDVDASTGTIDTLDGTTATFTTGNIATVNATTVNATTGNITTVNAGEGGFSGNVVIDGNLTVNGTTVTVSATNLAVEDNMIYLNEGSTVANPDLGIAGNYNDGTYAHAGFFRDATDGYWKVFKGYIPEPDASTAIDTGHASFALADIQAANFRGALVGNADTATTLATSRTLGVTLTGDVTGSGTVSFNGSSNATISFATTVAANSVALGTDTTGNYVAAGATSGNGISGSVSSEGGTFTVTSNATSSNTANTIVFRDASGNFSAGTITGTASSAKYADLAENYVGDASYEPGTVVEFGGDAEVTQCAHDMCTRVAGVVSTNPAYLMNNELEAEHVVAVAFTGRVPCKVVGPVRKGDMMVSAGNGAARAEENPKVGSIIGKALENFDGAEGVIEVVVGRF